MSGTTQGTHLITAATVTVSNSTLSPYISFDEDTRTITFTGDQASISLAGDSYNIDITLTDNMGNDSIVYTQTLVINTPVLPSFDTNPSTQTQTFFA